MDKNYTYIIVDSNDLDYINFNQIIENKNSLRYNIKKTEFIVKFKGDTPSFLDGKTQYTKEEIITILDDPNGIWFISEAEENTWKDNARTVLSKLNPFSWF